MADLCLGRVSNGPTSSQLSGRVARRRLCALLDLDDLHYDAIPRDDMDSRAFYSKK
jgi:hypothetical protein